MMGKQQQLDGGAASKEKSSDNASIQVLNLSFPRCGTMSMKAALDQLGYKCWHSTVCFGNTTQCRLWIAALDAKFLSKGTPFTRDDWDAVFRGYTAVSTDPPAVCFPEELIAAYPDAKVILVDRDEDAWLESFTAGVAENLFRWDLHAVAYLDPQVIGPMRDIHWHWVHSWWRVRSKEEMRAKAKSMFRAHNRTVRSLVPPHRLLEFRLDDGWGPLCEFLDIDVPNVPFPVRNDRTQVKLRSQIIRRRGLAIIGGRVLKIVGLLLGLSVIPLCLSIAGKLFKR